MAKNVLCLQHVSPGPSTSTLGATTSEQACPVSEVNGERQKLVIASVREQLFDSDGI